MFSKRLPAPSVGVRRWAGAALALLAACGPDYGTGPGEPPADPEITEEREVDLAAADLVYDRWRQVIYASVPADGGAAYASSIAVIDPVRGEIERSLTVGADPGRLAVSDDGQFLFVAHRGAARVTRIRLEPFTIDFQAALPGSARAADVEAIPGTPESFAVALESGAAGFGGVQVFDGQTPRGAGLAGEAGPRQIEPGPDAGTLFGYDGGDPAVFYVLAVDTAGVRVDTSRAGRVGPGLEMESTGERVFFSDGTLLNPATLQVVGSFDAEGFVVPDSANDRVFFLEPGGDLIQTFDADSRALLETYEGPGTGAEGSFILLGGTGLAWRTEDRVIVVPTSRALP